MAGGARPGAGRKPGSPNKATAEQRAAVEASGLTPLDFMLSVLRDDTQEQAIRLDAANKAAPYVHAKLATTTLEGNPDKPLVSGVTRVIIDHAAN